MKLGNCISQNEVIVPRPIDIATFTGLDIKVSFFIFFIFFLLV